MILIFWLGYVLPLVVSAWIMWTETDTITVKDLIKLIIMSAIPLLNVLVMLYGISESEAIKTFLNKKLK